MTYDRAAIMKSAWNEAKDVFKRFSYARHQLPSLFRDALIRAWSAAKKAARLAAMTIDQLKAEIIGMENTTRLGIDGIMKMHAYKAALADAERRAA